MSFLLILKSSIFFIVYIFPFWNYYTEWQYSQQKKTSAFRCLLEKQHTEAKCTNLDPGIHNDLSADET